MAEWSGAYLGNIKEYTLHLNFVNGGAAEGSPHWDIRGKKAYCRGSREQSPWKKLVVEHFTEVK